MAEASGTTWRTSQCSTIFAVVLQAEDVDTGVVVIAGPDLVAVEHDEVALGDDPLELLALAWILARHAFEVVDEGLLRVPDVRVVLDADVAREPLDGLGGMAPVRSPGDVHICAECLDLCRETPRPELSSTSARGITDGDGSTARRLDGE